MGSSLAEGSAVVGLSFLTGAAVTGWNPCGAGLLVWDLGSWDWDLLLQEGLRGRVTGP